MKTKEEILAQKTDWVSEQPFSKLKANVLEAMQLYSDQQNKELREKLQRLTERNKYLEEHSNERFEQANELNDKDQEIQRLTKEVEEYKVVVKNYDKIGSEKTETITSLRELVTQYLDNSTSDNAYGADVRDRIFNELNHKP